MRLGDTIYYCKKKEGVEEYEAPKPITLRFNYFTLQPASDSSDVMVYGEDIDTRYNALAPFSIWGNTFAKGDKFYIDYHEPLPNEENGKNANAEVTAVLYQNRMIRIKIRTLV